MKTFGIILLALLLVIAAGYLALYKPWIVTDPNDPNFEPSLFRFENYTTERELRNALITMFPKGTKRDYVDHILIDNANLQSGLRAGDDGGYYIYYLYYPNDDSVDHGDYFLRGKGRKQSEFYYDNEDNVTSIKVHILAGKRPPLFFIGKKIIKVEKP